MVNEPLFFETSRFYLYYRLSKYYGSSLTKKDVEDSFDGVICRCTGIGPTEPRSTYSFMRFWCGGRCYKNTSFTCLNHKKLNTLPSLSSKKLLKSLTFKEMDLKSLQLKKMWKGNINYKFNTLHKHITLKGDYWTKQ